MPHVLGVEVGVDSTRAAVCRHAADRPVWGPADPVVSDGPAAGRLLTLVGDDVPVLVGDRLVMPPAIVADAVRVVVDTVWTAEQEYPDRIAVAHPTGWGRGRAGLLRAALEEAGTGDVTLVAAACAITERFRAARLLPADGQPVAVCRLDAAGVEVSLVVPHEWGSVEVLGSAELDDLAVAAPAVVDLLLATAGPWEPAAVLLAGEGATDPGVADVLAAAVGAPLLRDDDPLSTVACGAALSVRPPDPPAVLPAGPLPAFEESPTVTVSTGQIAAAVGAMPPRPPLHVAAPPAGRR